MNRVLKGTRSASVLVTAAALTVGLTAASASATSRYTGSGCTQSSSYWTVNNYYLEGNYSLLCFANAGTLNMNVYDVDANDSGNNTGYVFYTRDGGYYETVFNDRYAILNWYNTYGDEVTDEYQLNIN